jgi:uncharacterized membrane protein YkoI
MRGNGLRVPASSFNRAANVMNKNLLPYFSFLLIASVAWSSLAITATAAPPAPAQQDEKGVAAERAATMQALPRAKMTMLAAVQAALVKVPGGKAVEVYFGAEGKEVFYVVAVLSGGKSLAVEIDALTGVIHGVSPLDGEEKAERELKEAFAKSKISLSTAIAAALKKSPTAKPFDVHPGKKEGKLLIFVDLLVGNKIIDVDVDALTGEIAAVEEAKE